MTLPYCVALCPTYRRSKLLENSIACFEAQDYPEDRRELIILDDSGELVDGQNSRKFTSRGVPTWRVISTTQRYESLPQKYNAMLKSAEHADVVFVWEDDDIYTPNHISSTASMCPMVGYAKSPTVWSLYDQTKLQEEGASGRFHASLCMSRALLDKIGGWPKTKSGDFDQKLIASLEKNGHQATFGKGYKPTYVFRWGSTQSYHGQAYMKTAAYEYWWEDVQRRTEPEGQLNSIRLTPKMDEETKRTIDEIAKIVSAA